MGLSAQGLLLGKTEVQPTLPLGKLLAKRDRVRDQVLWRSRQKAPFCGFHPELRT